MSDSSKNLSSDSKTQIEKYQEMIKDFTPDMVEAVEVEDLRIHHRVMLANDQRVRPAREFFWAIKRSGKPENPNANYPIFHHPV